MKDLEVISYYFSSMEEAYNKLSRAVGMNNAEEANKLKKMIADISGKIAEELV